SPIRYAVRTSWRDNRCNPVNYNGASSSRCSAARRGGRSPRAQQAGRGGRIGGHTGVPQTDSDALPRAAAFRQELHRLGWTEGRNMRFDYRWGSGGNSVLRRRYAAELVALAPDVILVGGSASTEALQQASQTVPIVFVGLADPVGAGFVDSLSRP